MPHSNIHIILVDQLVGTKTAAPGQQKLVMVLTAMVGSIYVSTRLIRVNLDCYL